MSALYTATAHVTGGRNGHGRTTDGLLDLDLAVPKELGGAGGATNPEQLFAIGYAACFEGALRLVARRQKASLQDAAINSSVSLLPQGEGFKLAVALDVETKGVDQATAEQLVATAHQVCPYSNATRGNIDVTFSVKAA
ncbi:MAG: organic hydroperoxide resistance protein [Rhizobiaceae bacterium]|nr:organic hydroperoxide resistance protein [Rhizobiaceae bacterium]